MGVRPISDSSGTSPFWRRAWALLPIGLFFELFFNMPSVDSFSKGVLVRPISASSGTPPFWQRAWALSPVALVFESNRCKLKNNSKFKETAKVPHTRCQKGRIPEEAKIGRTITTFVFFTCALGAPMTAYPLDAVSAAEPLCTHGKDHPGLGGP